MWGARLPAIKESLHLSDGQLGLALFAMPAGSVLTLPVSGRVADRFGLARVLGSPARLRGALEAPSSLVARRGLLAPQSRQGRAIAGFALLGAGLAANFPQIITVAAAPDPARSGRNIGPDRRRGLLGPAHRPGRHRRHRLRVGLRSALLVPAALALVTAAAAGVMGGKS